MTTLDTITRTTLDGFRVTIEGGCLSHAGGTFTRHAPLRTMVDVLALAEAVSLFERAEMPSLATAAATLAKRGPLAVWAIVEKASILSDRAGTRPADMLAPESRKRAKPGPFLARNSETGIPVWIGGIDPRGRLVAEDPR